jgi:hypothetical protein
VHFLKTVSAMRYVAAVLRWERQGQPRHSRACCARMVWPTERRRHPPSACYSLLDDAERTAESALDAGGATGDAGGGAGGGRGGARRRGRGARREAAMRAAAAKAERTQSVGA